MNIKYLLSCLNNPEYEFLLKVRSDLKFLIFEVVRTCMFIIIIEFAFDHIPIWLSILALILPTYVFIMFLVGDSPKFSKKYFKPYMTPKCNNVRIENEPLSFKTIITVIILSILTFFLINLFLSNFYYYQTSKFIGFLSSIFPTIMYLFTLINIYKEEGYLLIENVVLEKSNGESQEIPLDLYKSFMKTKI